MFLAFIGMRIHMELPLTMINIIMLDGVLVAAQIKHSLSELPNIGLISVRLATFSFD